MAGFAPLGRRALGVEIDEHHRADRAGESAGEVEATVVLPTLPFNDPTATCFVIASFAAAFRSGNVQARGGPSPRGD